MLLPVRMASAMASLGLASMSKSSSLDSISSIGSWSGAPSIASIGASWLSFKTARNVLSSIAWMMTRSRCRSPAANSCTIKSWLKGRGEGSPFNPAMMLWAWAWSIQIGTCRRRDGSRSRTIGLRLAASNAIPITLISTIGSSPPLLRL